MNVHSISSELATVAKKARGVVPPKLVGASTTVVGDKMYLFGGRLVVERRMLSDLYVFDLPTATWTKIELASDSIVPGPRYFHSADTWNNHLVIFGGMGYKTSDSAQESLCVLNDVCFYSLAQSRWLAMDETPPSPSSSQSLVPRARYAHLSSVSSNMLFIIGGQDLDNGWLDDIHVYDLPSRSWVHRSNYPRHCGTYRSVALSSSLCVRDPSSEPKPPSAPRFRADDAPSVIPVTSPEGFVQLPYSAPPSPRYPSEIFLYSNYNFTDVRRELEVFTPQPPSSFTITDRSTSMTGLALPPGLRFPTGALLSNSLIIAGTYLAHSYQAFSIWSLDLTTMTWSRIEPGNALATGSWCRAVLWRESNKLLVFGNREGNLVEDYNHRLLSWDDIAYIDLEAFGIYQPPSPGFGFGPEAQAMGLAALEDGAFADFEVICDDGRRIACSRKLLEDRWPWFRTQRQRYVAAASSAVDLSGASLIPPLPLSTSSTEVQSPRADPRLTPRTLSISEPYPIVVAFLQYLYAQALITPLQHAPPVLSALLMLASTYDMTHLRDLVKHAMHKVLSASGSGLGGIYEVATLCDCQSLRLRAIRMSRKRHYGRTRSSRPDERHGSGSSQGRGSGQHHARPRGMSDANQSQQDSSTSGEQNQSFAGQPNGSTSHSSAQDRLDPQEGSAQTQSPPEQPSDNVHSRKLSELKPVSGQPSPIYEHSFVMDMGYSSSFGFKSDSLAPKSSAYPVSEDDDDDIDLELLGLDQSFYSLDLPPSRDAHSRVSYNARPSWPQYHSHPPDGEDYYFGTQPDLSPLTSTFPAPERPAAFHLPYPAAYQVSQNTRTSDTPPLTDLPTNLTSEETHSSASLSTSSAYSSVPVTPLSPALAEIVDAVAKINLTPASPDRHLTRQTSLRSIDENASYHDHANGYVDSDDKTKNLYNFPLPPLHNPLTQHQLPKLKTNLSNISETEIHGSQDRLRINTSIRSEATNDSVTSFKTPMSARSLGGKRSYDFISPSGRRSTISDVPQSGGGLARLLSPRRSGSRLEKEFAKARSKADKLERKLREQEEKERRQQERDQGDVPPTPTSFFSGMLSPKGHKSEGKKRQGVKEPEKQKLRGADSYPKAFTLTGIGRV